MAVRRPVSDGGPFTGPRHAKGEVTIGSQNQGAARNQVSADEHLNGILVIDREAHDKHAGAKDAFWPKRQYQIDEIGVERNDARGGVHLAQSGRGQVERLNDTRRDAGNLRPSVQQGRDRVG